VVMDPKALQLLTAVGAKTSLRYALQMIASSHLLAKRRKSLMTEVVDVKRSYELFADAGNEIKGCDGVV
jgi:RuvB-like protein 2